MRANSLFVAGERTRRRHQSERRFRLIGLAAVIFGILALIGLLGSILANGASSFRQTYVAVDIFLDPAKLDKSGNRNLDEMAKVTTFGYKPLIEKALEKQIEERGITVEGLKKADAGKLISKEAPASVRNYVLAHPEKLGETVPFDLLVDGRVDGYYKGRVTMESAALDRNVSPEQLLLADELKAAGVLDTRFNWSFF
ncbi:MAG: DUF3333 domain-containing protein, partial [Nitratireductor sp.]|nr:DUF3333 domain-containing protein [Nitratireductor sp.]